MSVCLPAEGGGEGNIHPGHWTWSLNPGRWARSKSLIPNLVFCQATAMPPWLHLSVSVFHRSTLPITSRKSSLGGMRSRQSPRSKRSTLQIWLIGWFQECSPHPPLSSSSSRSSLVKKQDTSVSASQHGRNAWMCVPGIPALGNQALWLPTARSEIVYFNVMKTSCNVLIVKYKISNSVLSASIPKEGDNGKKEMEQVLYSNRTQC